MLLSMKYDNVYGQGCRFSLILSKTMKLEVDLTNVVFDVKGDERCTDNKGNFVFDKDGNYRRISRHGINRISSWGTAFAAPDILKNALEESQRGFSNKRTALKVALNRGGMDELGVAKMILSGIPLDESFLQYRMSVMLNEDRKNLLGGKLPITESYYLMGTVDPSKTLKSGEVSIILDNGQISGKVLVYRSPGVHFGDVHVLTARYVDGLNEYVGHAKYAIFFPCDGSRSLADEMAGGDFDGDMFFVSQNPQFCTIFSYWIISKSVSHGKKNALPLKGPIYDYVKSYQEEVSKKEVRKLPCFDIGILEEESREKWTALYEEYRKDMADAQKFPSKAQIDAASNAVYDKYKKELYGALELEERQRPMDEIRKEAVAIYNICYDYAMEVDNNMLGGNLKQQLNRAWPNLMGAILNIDFWLDEWAKHGMCSDYGDNPVAYFSTAINLRNNVVSGLNLVTGIADTVDNIANTVYPQVKVRPEIHCFTRRASASASAQKLLGELRFCYQKGHLTIQNCTRLYSGDCNSGRDSITLL
ncbi:hypothetical protein V6N12_047719 [Hibiscus sabdariffa]|uniref:RNA-dependent RNA polymerase n=1 Tax=Hibiscus sabdariffa TaxID=183260 RepID=A0ABR2CTT1_9ROSI